MKSKLVAYGRIQKGRRRQYLLVVLDERIWGKDSRWRRAFRFFSRPAGS